MPNPYAYNEQNISQIPAIQLLKKLGYNYLYPHETDAERKNRYNVILKDTLKQKLLDFNAFEYKGKTFQFSEKNINQALQDIDEALSDGLVKTNEKIYNSLILGKSYSEHLPDGNQRSFTINYIDWEHPENNIFHVTEEFVVERDNGHTVRPDIVLFINGIPLGVIECKRSSVSIHEGISQMLRNQGKEYIPHLFKFVQIVMSTNKNETKYATCSTPKEFWAVWKEQETDWHENLMNETVSERKHTIQDKNIVSLFHPQRFLDLIKYFTVFDANVRKIARYQQYFAIKEIIETIRQKDENGNRQSGVIWHTQGSGKSLTMVMLAKYLLSELQEHNPKIVVVTDRKNLDKQIFNTFTNTRTKAKKASSGRNLVDLINDNGADVITTLVHKFDKASEIKNPVLSKDVFVLVDESHRTQYGELHIKMKKVFPNACYLGFTGTPLMKKEKSTMIKFGKLIHKYTIADGVADKAIVPLLYEGKMVEQTVNQKAIDNRLEIITRNLNDKQKEDVKKKWSQFERIASSEQRLKLIAFDINEHFFKHYKTEGIQFKAMLATTSKIEAVRYLDAFIELGDLNCAVVVSPPDQREGHEAVDKESKDRVQNFWNDMMKRYIDAEKYEEHIKDEFVKGDDIDMLIVVDKLLTGFDAPKATVLYIDKPMKEHTLLQAIARVNRLHEGKDYGYIIDYRGLLELLDEAMKVYSGAGLENFDPEDLQGAVYDVISIVGTLRHYYSELVKTFASVQNKKEPEEYELLLENDEKRKDFYEVLSQFGKNLGIALESEKVYEALKEKEIKNYKRDLKFYQELRKSVKLRYSDGIDHKEYEAKMQKLMDNYIAAEDIIRITNPVDILNTKAFEEELDRLGSKRAKADAIRTRMSKKISEKYEENPTFHKKFSERIQEVLQMYKEQRISEAEYLQKMNDIKEDFVKGDSGEDYPEIIKENKHAQAFYGSIKQIVEENNDMQNRYKLIGQLALEVNTIIKSETKVDWHDNPDVHKHIEQKIEDLLYEYIDKHSLKIDHSEMDLIIESIKKIALRRY